MGRVDPTNLHLWADYFNLAALVIVAAARMAKRSELRQELAPLVEAEVISTVFITGGAVEIDGALVRVMGWSEFPVAGEISDERRLALRLVMPLETAIKLADAFAIQLRRMRGLDH